MNHRCFGSIVAVLGVMGGACARGGERADTAKVSDTGVAAPRDSAAIPAGGLLDPDRATRAQLMALPGIDSATAAALESRRPFATMLAVDSVLAAARLTESQRDTIYARVFKPLDLNAATAAEIELIPGVGRRMRQEFEEYRPYSDIARFRREIGKYVDSAEVARLERYVRIP